MKLKDKVAIVTGASRGLGRAFALAFAREGAMVTLAARTVQKSRFIAGTLYETADQIAAECGRALPVPTDVADERSVEHMVRKTLDAFHRIDILINNAATNRPALFARLSQKKWDEILAVNLRGTVLCTRAVLSSMLEQKGGHIINLSSMAALEPGHDPMTGLAYDVSKAAVNRFTIGLAEELKPYSIAVNVLMVDNTVTEGWSYLNPAADKSSWYKPELWAAYAVHVATRDPSTYTGRVLTEQDLRKETARSENI
jgi:NAD(P)-dependent dehydrogenase (short-subunit alcohol dehydrogenase family)